ncbi:tRNA pseudouridine(13) synthase TruD [uncultured Pseudoteredinibacter sp.]|uniref:tRNA pseudouridine(13) synthase TruD n=1 Tax=uncultured Pseudoteredinibacter sp. TaxID=1641701 RepID=UPI002616AFC9|nr:tRNA pseudouridine(13) synthase TruD [uncultured Pseudoteredinibacter sp.]
MTEIDLNFAYAYGEPLGTAGFRTEFEDFQVYEQLPSAPEGEGEHVYLYVRKTNNNTAWIAKQLARAAGIQNMDVGYAGLKDRRAVTEQWFSLYMPKGAEPNWKALDIEGAEVLQISRGRSKLRRGDHLDNRFVIRLRDLSAAHDELEERLKQISLAVPNYFGEQRFGVNGANLERAAQWFDEGVNIRNRQQKKFIVSAARSYLFNLVLSERVASGSWLHALEGEYLLDGQPSGPMWGRGRLESSAAALELEEALLALMQNWQERLEHLGLRQDRRLLAIRPVDFSWQFEDRDLCLEFKLPPGAYATSILRELCQLQQPELVEQ